MLPRQMSPNTLPPPRLRSRSRGDPSLPRQVCARWCGASGGGARSWLRRKLQGHAKARARGSPCWSSNAQVAATSTQDAHIKTARRRGEPAVDPPCRCTCTCSRSHSARQSAGGNEPAPQRRGKTDPSRRVAGVSQTSGATSAGSMTSSTCRARDGGPAKPPFSTAEYRLGSGGVWAFNEYAANDTASHPLTR